MRLAKSVGAVLSIVASGGVMLALSGYAYAAESDAGTIAQGATQVNITTTENTIVKKAGEVVAGVSAGSASSDQVKKTAATPEVKPVSGGDTPDVSATIINSQTVTTPNKDDDTTAGASEPSKLLPTRGEPTDKQHGQEAGTITVIMPVTKEATEVQTSTGSQADRPTLRPTVLAIQPRITGGRLAVVEDLATAVPSAPVVEHKAGERPEPPRPNGGLSRFTATLAGSVVPSVFLAPMPMAAGLIMAFILLAVQLLPLLDRTMTAGGWWRRGGYAHAARSDVAPAHLSLFATPLQWGYAAANGPTQSPFLVVSDRKSLVSGLPTLSERRN